MLVVARADSDVTAGGFDLLILGSGGSPGLAGSREYRTENPQARGGVGYLASYLDGRLVTAGTLYAPEPATLSLSRLGAAVVPLPRRGRTRT